MSKKINKSKYFSLVAIFSVCLSALSGLPPAQAAISETAVPFVAQSSSLETSETIVKVSNGMRHTCALTSSGRVACWGDGSNGQLGISSSLPSAASPTFLSSISDAIDISAGSYHTCAVLQTGKVQCWGVNSAGQLGDGTTTYAWVPVDVSGINNAVSVSVGAYHSCALTSQGSVFCWGSDDIGYGSAQTGQLGNGLPYQSSAYPSQVIGLDGPAVQISAGESHTCAVLANKKLQCWGKAQWGELGNGSTVNSPVPVTTGTFGTSGVSQVAAGFENTCALDGQTENKDVYCWGFKTWGTLGDDAPLIGNYVGVASPVKTVVSGATYLDLGGATACAIKNREVWCWGSNQQGILQTQFVPTNGWFEARSAKPFKVTLPGPVDKVSVSDGVQFESTTAGAACAWSDTEVYCWGGSDATGQQGFGDYFQGPAAPQKVNLSLTTRSLLKTFTVNGIAVQDGSTVSLDYGNTSVDVIAEAEDLNSTVNISGSDGLVSGDNTLTVTVTRADGVTIGTYSVILSVAYNNDASLATFTVNGIDVVDGDSIELGYGVNSVDVLAETTDPNATFEIAGSAELVVGENELLISVTAADGVTTETYTVTLIVSSNSDVSLSLFEVNGEPVQDGVTVELPPYTIEVEVTAWATDTDATVEIEGSEDLKPGENILTVSVTAADTVTAETYVIYLYVPLGNEVSLTSLTVNGELVSDGASLTVDSSVTEVVVDVETADPDATWSVSGSDNLSLGENTITVTVVAADGSTTGVYSVTLIVSGDSDSSLAIFTVNGQDVNDGDTIYMASTSDLEIVARAASPLATVVVEGGEGLAVGENQLLVTVTASDGSSSTYSVTLVVLDMSLSFWLVNQTPVGSGDELEVAPNSTEVTVEVGLTDETNTFEVFGDTELVPGNNTLIVRVTSESGYVYEHSMTIYVPTQVEVRVSTVSLSFNSPFGNQVVDVEPNQIVRIPYLLDGLDINVETLDPQATYQIFGAENVSGRTSNIRIEVTGRDGITKGTFEFVVQNTFADVQAYITSEKTNKTLLENGGTLHLPHGVSSVSVIPANEKGNCNVYGDQDLVTGENIVALECQAPDGSIELAYFYLVVDENNDASVVGVTVDGVDVQDGSRVDLEEGADSVDVSVETTDPNASVVISGDRDLVEGENQLTIWVLAADGITFRVLNMTLIVPKSSNTSVNAIKVNGLSYLDGDVAELSSDTTDVEVEVDLADPDASYTISGGENLRPGINALVVRVTAANLVDFAIYTILLDVAMSSDASWNSIYVNGMEWSPDVPIEVPAGNLDVFVETNHPQATVLINGKTRNVHGIFDLEIVVTAQDGETTQSAIVTIWATEKIAVVPMSSAEGPELRVGSRVKIAQLPMFDKSYTFFYYWLRDGEVVNDDLRQTYLLKPEDLEGAFRPYIFATKPGAEPVSYLGDPLTILPGLIKKAPTPTIMGTPIVGKTLTLSTKKWAEPVELSYQWYSDGEAIDGATEISLEVSPELLGTRISVGVTGAQTGYLPLEKLSKGILVKAGTFKYTKAPKVTGTFSTGKTIIVDTGLWPDFAEVSIIWKRNGEEVESTADVENGYTFTGEDYKSKFSVVVRASAPGYLDSEFVLTRAVSIGYFNYISAPRVVGDLAVGETLSVELPEIPEFAEVSYVWKRNGVKISSASESEYEIQPRDFGMFVSVMVVVSAQGYRPLGVESKAVRIRSR